MKIIPTPIDGVFCITPAIFEDARGHFLESFNQAKWQAEIPSMQGLNFIQDNHSVSKAGVIRGLHYQNPHPQGKLVRVVKGSIYDVAVDIRTDSATFGQYFACILSAENHQQLWIPPGLAHGFLALEDAHVLYKTTDYWHANCDHTLLWSDAYINISWPLAKLGHAPIISDKDQHGHAWAELLAKDALFQ